MAIASFPQKVSAFRTWKLGSCGITVVTVHRNERSNAAVIERCRPQLESMEGAGFMYACLINKVRFVQVRAVSNLIEKRNRKAWDLESAIRKRWIFLFAYSVNDE